MKGLFILAVYVTSAMTMPDVRERSLPVPQYCFTLPEAGAGRASLSRYRYRETTNECELFIWGGGETQPNIFPTLEECQQTCKRRSVSARIKSMNCRFSANLGRACSLTNIAGASDIQVCSESGISMTQEECASIGCCWSRGICFQIKSRLVRSSCTMKEITPNEFWGKVDFQADANYFSNWVGSLTFNSAITGGFCLLDTRYNYVTISRAIRNRTAFILPAVQGLQSGEKVVLLFKGKLDSSSLNTTGCAAGSRAFSSIERMN